MKDDRKAKFFSASDVADHGYFPKLAGFMNLLSRSVARRAFVSPGRRGNELSR